MGDKYLNTLVLAAVMLGSVAVAAAPAGDIYAGILYGQGNYSEKHVSRDFRPTALSGRLGYHFHPSFSLQGRLGFGVSDDTRFLRELGASGLDARYGIDYLVGAYGTGHARLTEHLSFYGAVGISSIEATARVPGFPAAKTTKTETGLSYGIGAEFVITRRSALDLEFMQYLDKSNFRLNMISLGWLIHF